MLWPSEKAQGPRNASASCFAANGQYSMVLAFAGVRSSTRILQAALLLRSIDAPAKEFVVLK